MAYLLHEVQSHQDLKDWVRFPYDLYRGDSYFIPQIYSDEVAFFSKKNPVYEVVKQRMFLVKDGQKIVGRISGVIHSLEEPKIGYRRGRFGWIEMIHDYEVARILLDACKNWFLSEGCKEMTGPHGFSDLDSEGLLVEGFEELPTIAASYNPPYYQNFIEKYGFQKQADYIEFRVKLPEEEPKFLARALKSSAESPYRVKNCQTKKELFGYASKFWHALEASFAHLYGVTPLTDKQMAYYTEKYFNFLDPRYVHLAFDQNDNIVGFFITMPNLSRAFQKAKGKLFPFGFLHLLRGMNQPDTVDFLLAGVDPSCPNSPLVITLMSLSVYRHLKSKGIQYIETNRELEENTAVTKIWSRFDSRQHRRSRMYGMNLATPS